MLNEWSPGVRSAIHAAIRARGYDPLDHDPWYFPSIEDYAKVRDILGAEDD